MVILEIGDIQTAHHGDSSLPKHGILIEAASREELAEAARRVGVYNDVDVELAGTAKKLRERIETAERQIPDERFLCDNGSGRLCDLNLGTCCGICPHRDNGRANRALDRIKAALKGELV